MPGIFNFLALSLYTRLLSTQQYGEYTLVISSMSLANAVLFQWLRLGLLRFLPSHSDRRDSLLSTLGGCYCALIVPLLIIGIGGSLLCPDPDLSVLVFMATILLCTQAAFEASLELARCQLAPRRYGLLLAIKAGISFMLGALAAYSGFGVRGVLSALLIGNLLPLLWEVKHVWVKAWPFNLQRSHLVNFASYGLPLTATFLLEFVLTSSDRYIIGWSLGTGAAGVYAAGYDLSAQSLGVLMTIVNLAAYPLAIRAFEREGAAGATMQLKQNFTTLLGVAFPVATAMAILAPNLTAVFLGADFAKPAAELMPWIVFSALVGGVKAFHFDVSFQLGKKTTGQVRVVLISAILNIALNMLFIPRFGVMGAAYATFVAYVVGLVCSCLTGRKVFVVPVPWLDLFKVFLSVTAMAAVITPMRDYAGAPALALQVSFGIIAYAASIFALNLQDIRGKVLKRFAYDS